LNKILTFIIFICITVSVFADTDEVEIFSDRAKKIIDSLEGGKITQSEELLQNTQYRISTLKIISMLTEGLQYLKVNNFEKVNEIIASVKKEIENLPQLSRKLKVQDYKIVPLEENRLRLLIRFQNDSKKIIEKPTFFITIYDKDGNKIDKRKFYIQKNIIQPHEEFEYKCYFYNIIDPKSIVKAEFKI